MKILTKCPVCKSFSFLVYKRQYITKTKDAVTTNSQICGKCARGIARMIR